MDKPLKRITDVAVFTHRASRFLADRVAPVPEASGTPHALALFHEGRCGSTVLGALLSQNPHVYWDGEALLPHRPSERWFRRLQGARGEDNLQDLRALMRYSRGRVYTLSAKGRFGYPRREDVLPDLLALGFDHFVTLERRNLLRWVVSVEVGKQHRAWHRRRGQARRRHPVRVPLADPHGFTILDQLQRLKGDNEDARRRLAEHPTLHLVYEDHIRQDPRVAYRAVCDHLGIEPTPVEITHERVNPYPLDQTVSNYAEVRSVIEGTEFEWMASD